ncbi:hypothetical protein KCU64_g581, partial [Aureobasidium melanogenum]
MADHKKNPKLKTPREQQSYNSVSDQRFYNSDDEELKPADGGRIEHQVNDHDYTIIHRPLSLPLHTTTTTQPLAPSLLSPFNPSKAELVGHNHVRSEMPAARMSRGPEYEQGAMRAMETTMHLAQIVRMSSGVVADEEKESDEATMVAKGKAEVEDDTEEGQEGQDDEEGEKEKGENNGEDVAEHGKSRMFKHGLETLNKEYWDDSNRIVDAWMDRYFQLGGDAGAVTASGSGRHSTLGRLNNPDGFETPRQAPDAPVSPSTVVLGTVRRVRVIDELHAASRGTGGVKLA